MKYMGEEAVACYTCTTLVGRGDRMGVWDGHTLCVDCMPWYMYPVCTGCVGTHPPALNCPVAADRVDRRDWWGDGVTQPPEPRMGGDVG